MSSVSLTWRDRLQIVNSLLFCVVGGVLIARYFLGNLPLTVVMLGAAFLGLGVYRLVLAGREMRKRARNNA